MKISILIPTHDRPNFFRKSLESALCQNYSNLEIIVSDDSNITKYAEDTVKGFSSEKIKFFSKKPSGPTDNYINLLRNATGEYAIFLDDDDFFIDKESIDKYVKHLQNDTLGVILQPMRKNEIKKFFSKKEVKKFNTKEFFLNFPNRPDPCSFQLGQLMFKTEIVKGIDYHKFNQSPFLDEVTLFLLCLENGSIVESNEIGFYLSVHENNMTWNNEEAMVSSMLTHIDEVSMLALEHISDEKVMWWRDSMIKNYNLFFRNLR